MPEDISAKLLTQTSENIQKLFDLSTRFDERVKSVSNKQEQLDDRIEELIEKQNELGSKIAIIQSQMISAKEIVEELKSFNLEFAKLDKRLNSLENQQGDYDERWKNVASFFLQLVWVILAAYLLTKLNLQSPAVP